MQREVCPNKFSSYTLGWFRDAGAVTAIYQAPASISNLAF